LNGYAASFMVRFMSIWGSERLTHLSAMMPREDGAPIHSGPVGELTNMLRGMLLRWNGLVWIGSGLDMRFFGRRREIFFEKYFLANEGGIDKSAAW
jgi:hypothetical protein